MLRGRVVCSIIFSEGILEQTIIPSNILLDKKIKFFINDDRWIEYLFL